MKIVDQNHITKQMRKFKFLSQEKVFGDYMEAMDDYFLGNIRGRLLGAEQELNQQANPPYDISHRHWNIMPRDVRNSTHQEMLAYVCGWEDSRNGIIANPYLDERRGEIWNRAFWAYQRRVESVVNGRPVRWVRGNGEQILISELTSGHIRNILACLRGMGNVVIPDPYHGRSNDEWYQILIEELGNRS